MEAVRVLQICASGESLSAARAKRFEAALRSAGRADEAVLRLRLIGYYRNADRSGLQYEENVLWLYEKRPDLFVPGVMGLPRGRHGSAYRQAAALWRRHLDNHPSDLLLGKAFTFFTEATDLAAAERVANIGTQGRNQGFWFERLGWLLLVRSEHETDTGKRSSLYSNAQDAYCRSLLNSQHDILLAAHALVGIASSALESSQKVAQQASSDALGLCRHLGELAGAEIRHSTLVLLGVVALQEGDTDGAVEYLYESIRIRTPSMKAFGPDLRLADRLQRSRSREVSIFLQMCESICKSKEMIFRDWRLQIEAGALVGLQYPVSRSPLT